MNSRVDGAGPTVNVCVLGAGTMGAGIAGHLANLGMSVKLVDLTRDRAQEGIERMRGGQPPVFMTHEAVGLVEPIGFAEADSSIAEAQWVCEAIVEKIEAKLELLERVDQLAAPGAMLSSNTSGLPIRDLVAGRSAGFKRRFVGAHFFNPPRYLKLLELIPTEDTAPEEVERISRFLEDRVARRVVPANDVPGFIANRFGMWALFNAIHVAEELHLSVEETDLITGEFFGRPRSGTFKLADLIGIDIMVDIARGLQARIPEDPRTKTLDLPDSVMLLLSHGWFGEKTGHGYYRGHAKETLTLDLGTKAYRMKQEASFPLIAQVKELPLPERLRASLAAKDEVGEFTRNHLIPILRYADEIKDEVSRSVRDFDRVLRWGFGWQMGPFEMIDALGPAAGFGGTKYYEGTSYRGSDGKMHMPDPEPEYLGLADFTVVDEKATFKVRDLGDGVLALGLTTKMGMITPPLVEEMSDYLQHQKGGRFVLTSEARAFSVGYDMNVFLTGSPEEIEENLVALQQLGELLADRNVVAAVFGYVLGGGLELALSCGGVVAAAESRIGLPESRIGLVPAGRGTTLMRLMHVGSAKKLAEVASNLTEGKIFSNAAEARVAGFLRPSAHIVFNPDRLIWDAKQVALEVGSGAPTSWSATAGPVGGMIDQALATRRSRGEFSEYDVTIGEKIKAILVRSTSYEDALARERSEFADLLSRSPTRARLRHMVENGKPLRN